MQILQSSSTSHKSIAMCYDMFCCLSDLTAWADWWQKVWHMSLVQKSSKIIVICMNLCDYWIFCFMQLCIKFDCFAAEKFNFKKVLLQKFVSSAMFLSVQQCLFCWHFHFFFRFESMFCSLNLTLAHCKLESAVSHLQLVLNSHARFDD